MKVVYWNQHCVEVLWIDDGEIEHFTYEEFVAKYGVKHLN